MAIDHKARRKRIVEHSVALFAKVGYKDVTFQMIADDTGLSRTTIYLYFKDKREIFEAAIREAVGRIVGKYHEIASSNMTVVDRIRQICMTAIATLFDSHEFLSAVMDVIAFRQRGGENLTRKIMCHTIGMKRVIHSLLVEGMAKGEVKRIDADIYTDLLYTQFESTVLRLTASNDAKLSDVISRLELLLGGLSA